MEVPELFYGSIALAPVIVALVALVKLLGLPNEYAPWAAVILNVVAFILIVVTNVYPGIQEPVTIGLNFLIALLSTFGFYDAQKNVTQAIRS